MFSITSQQKSYVIHHYARLVVCNMPMCYISDVTDGENTI